MEENINPAIIIEQSQPLASEDFQKLLYEYFDDKGVLNDLRAHLRSKMVHLLNGTSIGKSLINKKREISPKLQALNLLIAEHMLCKGYHYSLSVFSTEVPLNITFQNLCNDDKISSDFHFSDSDMWDILETLGFSKSSENGLLIVSNYKNDSSESLLNCIIKNPNVLKLQEKVEEDKIDKDIDIEKFISYLTHEKIKAKVILHIVEQLKIVISNEIHNIRKSKEQEIKNVKEKLESDSFRKLERYKKKLMYMEEVFDNERKRLEVEVEEAKCNLKDCAETLQIKYESITQRESSLESRAEDLLEQEKRLFEKEKELQKQQTELIEDTNKYTELLKSLQETQIKNQETDINNRDNSIPIDKFSQATDKENIENVLMKQTIQQLQAEINNLRSQNGAYLVRIQELAIRSNSFIQELENRYPRIDYVGPFNTEIRPPGFYRAPSLPPRNYITGFGLERVTSNGGGEVGSSGASVSRPRRYRHFNAKAKERRLPKRQLTQSPSSEDYSPTETILKEAKTRLECLEKESTLIDIDFNKKFINSCERDYSSEGSTTSIIKEFQINLASITENLSKVFQRKSKESNRPSTSKQMDVYYVSSDSDRDPHKLSSIYREINYLPDNERDISENVFKVKNLIAELPENYIDNVNNLEVETENENKENQSCNSSGIIVGTSISTLYISPDEKSGNESKNGDLIHPDVNLL